MEWLNYIAAAAAAAGVVGGDFHSLLILQMFPSVYDCDAMCPTIVDVKLPCYKTLNPKSLKWNESNSYDLWTCVV
jgi:hypothetical protein